MRNKFLVLLLLSLLIVITACAEQECPKLNARAPEFSLNNLEGQTVKLKDYAGKTVILNFWQIACGWCEFEMPFLQDIYDKYSMYSLDVVAVNIAEDTKRVKAYIEDAGYTFTVLLDENAKVSNMYCVPALPATIFIDEDGLIRSAKPGAFQSGEEIEAYLQTFQ